MLNSSTSSEGYMIHSGRRKKETPKYTVQSENGIHRSAKLTAILGALVFTVFLCSSADSIPEDKQSSVPLAEGVVQVFAPVGNTPEEQKDASIVKDSSIWSYLESVIPRFIHGDT